jgi:hypothetical protein
VTFESGRGAGDLRSALCSPSGDIMRTWLVVLLAVPCGGCAASSAPAGPGARDGAPVDFGAADAPTGLAVYQLRFGARTAPITAPQIPVPGWCPGERTDDGMGHPFIDLQPGDQQAGITRTFSIWQYETQAPAGTVLRAEDGYDELASRGVSVRYLEIDGSQTNTWRADRGTVTIVSADDDDYALSLAGVHLVPGANPVGANQATGELTVEGTIVSVLPRARP